MAPSGKRRPKACRKPRRKKQVQLQQRNNIIDQQETTSSNVVNDSLGCADADLDDVCSTPKADRFRIPEINTCPPAPKKQRVMNSCSSLQRTPIPFFASPEIELFFFFALGNVCV